MCRATLTCICAALLAGCAQMPDLGAAGKAAIVVGTPYPTLQPLPVIAGRSATVTAATALRQRAAATDAQVGALRARAAALVPPVLDSATLARLNAALAARDGTGDGG
jgi:hypothetical protein